MGQTIGPSSGLVGTGGSATVPGVLMEDRWMGGGGYAAAPHELIGAGGSVAAPDKLIGAGGSAAVPEEPTEGGGPPTMPSEVRETSPSAREQGYARNSSVQASGSKNLGVHPQNVPTAQQRQHKSPIPLFFPVFLFFYFSV